MLEYKKLLITEDCTVIQAMQRLDQTAMKILFVADYEDRLLASLTDGDIRRWILNNGALDTKVSMVASYHPKYIKKGEDQDLDYIYQKYGVDVLPLIDENGVVCNILFANLPAVKKYDSRLGEIPVVMMAGGLGTRLYPYTKILPKALVPIGDVPIAEHIMNEFHQYGNERFTMIVNHKRGMIKSYFSETELPYSIDFVYEEEFLGTGGGLKLLSGSIDKTFFLTNCDILIKENYASILDEHIRQGNAITMICSAKEFTIPYGIVEINEVGQISKLKEKPSLSFLTNTGCYVVEPRVIDYISEGEAIGFPDVIDRCRLAGEKVGIYPISEEAWYDMGQMDELHRMERNLFM